MLILPKFQGHRGARGLMPENTVDSFIKTLELGLQAFELDVVISADEQVVVSHEAWFSHKICSKPNGSPISKDEALKYVIYQMPYEKIKQYDCGLRGHPDFITQVPQKAYKPLLSEVIDACEQYTLKQQGLPVTYNIEIKTEFNEKGDGIYQPVPLKFAQLVYKLIKKKNIANRCLVQSFDARIVQAMRQIDPSIYLSLLVDNVKGLNWNLNNLGFVPDVYAPYYNLITPEMVEAVHQKGMQLITWTVNDSPTMLRLINMGVDSVITDYPDKVVT